MRNTQALSSSTARPSRLVRVDTRERGGLFAEFLETSGLGVFETVTTMSKGRRLPVREAGMPWIYGLAGHAVG
jgi:hypothetical protein